MVNKTLVFLIALAYTVFLTIISLVSLENTPDLGSAIDDKIYHFIAYFIFAFLWITYYKHKKTKIKLVFLLLMAFGVILELSQHKINPMRIYDIYDLLANCLGIVIGTLFAYKLTVVKLK